MSLLIASCENNSDPNPTLSAEYFAGGETTVFSANSNAYSTPASNLSGSALNMHLDGDVEFEAVFVNSPAEVNPGLGPVFNNTSCIACHPKDGRAAHPSNLSVFHGLFLRVSLPGLNMNGGPLPVPGFGTQLQDHGVFGAGQEGEMIIEYEEIPVSYADGLFEYLRKPRYTIENSFSPLPAATLTSPRIAPPVFGLGLLEAITEEDILALADENDTDGNGISGKPNYVWNASLQTTQLGRFGWKANNSSVRMQTAGAYLGDIGITTSILTDEGVEGLLNQDGKSDDPEISNDILDAVTFYCQTLAVPAPRNLENEQIQHGKFLFSEAGCSDCHNPKFQTGQLDGVSQVSNQVIYPYTDLLLHDMGDGLADGRPDFLASSSEWKTRPLWGIGLTEVVNGHSDLLHDGRARNLAEAILWHGGEAEDSKENFRTMSFQDRESILAFLNAL